MPGFLVLSGGFPVGLGLFLGVKEGGFPAVYPWVREVYHILDIPVGHRSCVLRSQECPKGAGPWGYSRGNHRQQ